MGLASSLKNNQAASPARSADSELEDQWSALLIHSGVAPPLIVDSFTEIVESYADPRRHAGNLAHLRFVLARFHKIRHLARDLRALQFAVWLQTLSWRPYIGPGSVRSAQRAAQWMRRFGLPEREVNRTRELILAPRHGEPGPFDVDLRILNDVNLAILGAAPPEYDRYQQGLRQEYRLLPNFIYRRLRCARLLETLDRQRIYCTDLMYKKYEPAARANLLREFGALQFLD